MSRPGGQSPAVAARGHGDDDGDDGESGLPPLPPGSRNYMTPACHARLSAELDDLLRRQRPEVVEIVSWAASNGDRSENGDYIYGKKRLREIDRRIRHLMRRLDDAEVVDPAAREPSEQVFFGATVELMDSAGVTLTLAIVGIDETDPDRGYISWISPMARVLLRRSAGDEVRLPAPGGVQVWEIVDVRYEALT